MPTYKITDKNTGKTVRITGDTPPSQQQVENIMRQAGASQASKPVDEKMTFKGFKENVGESGKQFLGDIWGAVSHPVETVKGLGNLAIGTAQKLIPGRQEKEIYPEAVAQSYKERYTDESGKFAPGRAFYEDPFGVAGDISTVFGIGSGVLKGSAKLAGLTDEAGAASRLSKAAKVARNVETATDPLLASGSLLSKSPVGKFFSRGTDTVRDFGEGYAVKSTRIPTRSQVGFEKKLAGLDTQYGKTLPEFIKKTGLYGQDVEKAREFAKPLQEVFEESQAGKIIRSTDVQKGFGDAIAKLSSREMMRDPKVRKLREFLIEEARQFKEGATGIEKVEDLATTRKSLDVNTPSSAFEKQAFTQQKALADVYRDVINTTAGTTELGKELSALYDFIKRLEKAPKGKNTLPLNITRMVATGTGLLAGNTFLGKMANAIGVNALVSILNNPKVIGFLSKTAFSLSSPESRAVQFMEIVLDQVRGGVQKGTTFERAEGRSIKPKKTTIFKSLEGDTFGRNY